MKEILLIILFGYGTVYAQVYKDDFEVNKNLKEEVEALSSSSFMQYSGFIPSTFKEILISVSGNDFVDSLLINVGTDTLIVKGANIFDSYFRKDFALESVQSPTLNHFFKYRMFDSKVVKTAIVYFYAQYLKGNSISIKEMRKKCLKGNRGRNEKARIRLVKQARSLS
jgi:hypothetical protein